MLYYSFSVQHPYLQMGKYSGKTCRLLSMLSMTAAFFLVEITVGYITNSVALVADSFHMLSDVVALIVGFSSVRVSLDWLQSLKQFFVNVSYHILVASLTLTALF